MYAIYKTRFVGTVITTRGADFHNNCIGEEINEDVSVT